MWQVGPDGDVRLAGPRGKPGPQDRAGLAVARQVQPGKVSQIGLRHGDPTAVRHLGKERQTNELSSGNLGHGFLLVPGLVGRGVAVQHQDMCHGNVRQAELSSFTADGEFLHTLLIRNAVAQARPRRHRHEG